MLNVSLTLKHRLLLLFFFMGRVICFLLEKLDQDIKKPEVFVFRRKEKDGGN